MPMPELVKKNAEKLIGDYCRNWVPVYTNELLRMTYTLEDEAFTLFIRDVIAAEDSEGRIPVAQLRFCMELKQWTLHIPHGEGRWKFYLNARPTLNLARLLLHLKEDPLGFFRH